LAGLPGMGLYNMQGFGPMGMQMPSYNPYDYMQMGVYGGAGKPQNPAGMTPWGAEGRLPTEGEIQKDMGEALNWASTPGPRQDPVSTVLPSMPGGFSNRFDPTGADAMPGMAPPLPPAPTAPIPEAAGSFAPKTMAGKFAQWAKNNRDLLGSMGQSIASNPFGAGAGFAMGDYREARASDQVRNERDASRDSTKAALELMRKGGKITSDQLKWLQANPDAAAAIVGKQVTDDIFGTAKNPREIARMFEDFGDPVLARLARAGYIDSALELYGKKIEAGGELALDTEDYSRLRGEFMKANDAFSKLVTAYSTVQAAVQGTGEVSDVSLIYGYNKMVDPGARVTEGDMAIAENTGGVLSQGWKLYNDLLSSKGQKLAPNVRQDFIRQANLLYKEALGQYNESRKVYEEISQLEGADPRRVMPDLTRGAKEVAMGDFNPDELEPGDVWEGPNGRRFRFKGGDPYLNESHEEIR
jgi:hypothetical protein